MGFLLQKRCGGIGLVGGRMDWSNKGSRVNLLFFDFFSSFDIISN